MSESLEMVALRREVDLLQRAVCLYDAGAISMTTRGGGNIQIARAADRALFRFGDCGDAEIASEGDRKIRPHPEMGRP